MGKGLIFYQILEVIFREKVLQVENVSNKSYHLFNSCWILTGNHLASIFFFFRIR